MSASITRQKTASAKTTSSKSRAHHRGLARRRTDEIVAFFGEGVECRGKIVNHGNIRVDGRFEGEIHTKGSLLVGNRGMIEAKVKAGTVVTEGTIIGDITAKKHVSLKSSAMVDGELKTPQLFMEDGATLHTPWTLRMKKSTFSSRQLDAKGLNVIESQGVDQTHLFK